jgi:hypothetical protein
MVAVTRRIPFWRVLSSSPGKARSKKADQVEERKSA